MIWILLYMGLVFTFCAGAAICDAMDRAPASDPARGYSGQDAG